VTDGSIRDLDVIPEGFRMLAGMVRPFGGFAHLVDFGGAVNIQGMAVGSGDLIHADRHGATVIPAGIARDVAAAARKLMRQEKVVIDEAQRDGVTVASLKRAYLAALEVE
jgi:regulator of RNase E activity RraA